MEARKSKIKVPVDSVSSEGILPELQMVLSGLQLCIHTAKEVKELSRVMFDCLLLNKGTNSTYKDATS